MKIPAEWLDLAASERRFQRAGYDQADTRLLLQRDVLAGQVRVRVDGQLCPAEKVHLVRLAFDAESCLGWMPGGLIVDLNTAPGDGGFFATQQDYGRPCELSAADLNRRLRELRELETPVAPRTNRGGRPGSWNWGNAMIDLAAHMLQNKAADSPNVFAAFLRDWFIENSADGGPDDKLIRTWAKNAFQAWKPHS